MVYALNVGDSVPTFEAEDMQGNIVSTKKLLGQPYVLYFYPKDDTPGCTMQACDFRDKKPKFDKLDILVIGISPDSKQSHAKFSEKHKLNFILIGDTNHQICEQFEVWQEKQMNGKNYMGVVRSTFIVDGKNIIRWIERPVEVEGNVERVFEALKKMKL